ncbi:MAG: nucleotide pyrophosphatase/phosphodiesterase family protein [Acidobacteriota bacterium]
MRAGRRLVGTGLAMALAALVAAGATTRPLVVLVSIDGFGWDYLDRYAAPAIAAIARRGARADGLIPEFPSKTFPNHYTLVTGLRPARHGIVSNNMRDPVVPGRFALGELDVISDTRWWGGEPIWITAARQGVASGTMFWPGSDVEIAGGRPAYWRPFDDALPNRARTDQVLQWMALPESERPRILTLYYSDVDTAGHRHGPVSREVEQAVAEIDREIAHLVDGIAALGLAGDTNIVLVSDHGMAAVSAHRRIFLDDYVDMAAVDVIDWTPVLGVAPAAGTVDALHAALAGRHPALKVYRRETIPARYGLAGHPRVAPVIGIADEGWTITTRERAGRRPPGFGDHGYDPAVARSMHGLFVAAGPGIREGVRVPAFGGIHVYELLCALVGITPAPNDGALAATANVRR